MSEASNRASEPEGREGIVTVYDSMTGEYLGCMGRERWSNLILEDRARFQDADRGAERRYESWLESLKDHGP